VVVSAQGESPSCRSGPDATAVSLLKRVRDVMDSRKISGKQVAKDVQEGMHDNALMEKYELSPSQLRGLMKKLLDAGLIREEHLAGRTCRPELPKKEVPSGAPFQGGECPNCGTPRKGDEPECGQCGAVFAKFQAESPPSRVQSARDSGLSTDQIAGYFYAEDAERKEAARKKRLWIIYTAVGTAALSFFFVLIGYGKQVVVAYTLAVALFIFFYYLVVLYYAFKQSALWGIFALCFSPAAILFVILHWNTIFEGKILPRVWLALFVPLTILSFMAKYAYR
jgi:hypothetical protein